MATGRICQSSVILLPATMFVTFSYILLRLVDILLKAIDEIVTKIPTNNERIQSILL